MQKIRLDKWLWAVRMFKTRTQANDYCRLGRVEVNGQTAKASREIERGDEISVRYPEYTKKVRVKEVLKTRVGAKLVEDFMEDITLPEELERLELHRKMRMEMRPRGQGRPTKKERRLIERFKKY